MIIHLSYTMPYLNSLGEEMNHKKILRFFMLSCIAANIIYAQETKKLDAVTVTANKIEENLFDIPQSITVIDSEEIEEKGIKTIEDVIREIPNMSTTPDRGVKVNFRGLNASLFTANNPIVVYIDGIPIAHKYDFSTILENVEKIEVLRGPQGTLYGKDAIGGVIKIITKEPTNETDGSINIEHGKNNYKRGTFNLNTPIVNDKLFFNLNAEINSNDGWITNTYYDDDKAAKEEDRRLGTSLYYKPTDRLSTKLALKKEKSEDNGFKGYGIVGSSSLDQFNRDDAENNSYEMPMFYESNVDSQSLNIKYEADKYIVEGVTVHRKTDIDAKYDLDFTNGNYLDGSSMFNKGSSNTYSQELRISNKTSDGIRWIAGLYLDKEERKKDDYGSHVLLSGMDYLYNNYASTIDSYTQSVFAQSIVPLTEQLELTLGGRYQKIKKELDLDSYGYMFNMNTFGYDHKKFNYNDEETWSIFIPKIAMNYNINENFSNFVSISKGYMPGGFNSMVQSMNNKEDNIFKPQQSTNYEMGIKGAFDNFIFTASIFRMNIKDIQVYKRLISGDVYTDNADKAHSEGIEFDFRYFPIKNLEISGAFGFIKAKYDSYNVGDYNFSGEKIETTPSHTANLSIAYYHPKGFYARTDIKNQGSMYFYDDANKTFPKENAYTLVDAKIGYKFLDWDIYAYAKNITDEKYIDMYEANNMFSRATFGEPRFLGIGVKYTF